MLNAFLQAVGALASVVGGYSAYTAFLAMLLTESCNKTESCDETKSRDEIGFAVDFGLAISFLPALIASIYLYLALSGPLR